jgi:hypothetical protein
MGLVKLGFHSFKLDLSSEHHSPGDLSPGGRYPELALIKKSGWGSPICPRFSGSCYFFNRYS